MKKDRLINLTLLLGSLISTALLIEIGLRAFGDEPPATYRTVLGREKVREPFPGVLYLYPGHASYTQLWPSNPRGYFDPETNGITYRVNNYGFRGGDFTLARSEKIRIAFLGDSFCWGLGVREADLFATLIEQRLNQQESLGRRYEVYNFCLPGYSTAEEAALYFYVVRHFQPDVLVVWYHLNDVDSPAHPYIDRGARRDIVGRIDREERSRWRLLELARTSIRRMSAHRRLTVSIGRAYEDGHPGLATVEGAFKRIRRVSQEADVPRFLAVFPWLYRLDGESYPFRKAHQAVALRAAGEAFEVLDLLPVFDGSRTRDLWVHPVDPHPNEVAHAMVAQAMSKLLETRFEEMAEALLAAARARCQLPPPSPLEDPPAREWYRPFVMVSRGDG